MGVRTGIRDRDQDVKQIKIKFKNSYLSMGLAVSKPAMVFLQGFYFKILPRLSTVMDSDLKLK